MAGGRSVYILKEIGRWLKNIIHLIFHAKYTCNLVMRDLCNRVILKKKMNF